MALKEEVEESEVESLGAMKEHYAKGADGKYRPVAADGTVLVHGTKAMTALEKERAARRATEAKLLAFSEISDPNAAIEAMRQVAQMKDWTPADKVEEVAKARVQQVVTANQAELAKRDAEEKRLRGLLHERVVENAALSAMAAMKLDGADSAVLFPHVMKGLRMVEQGGKVVARVYDGDTELTSKDKNDGTPMGVEEYVASFRSKFPKLFPGSGSSGGGAGSGSAAGGGVSSGGVLLIKSSDHATKSKHLADIASGKARVVED